MVMKADINKLAYPRVIAHRGLSGLYPENTMEAFDAAIELGVHEIELDIWGSKDRRLIVCHDPTVDRTSNGTGHINDLPYEYIAQLDAGSWFDRRWAGLSFSTLEEVIDAYGDSVVMNIHLKESGEGGWIIQEVDRLAREYGVVHSIYIAGEEEVLKAAIEIAPHIERCCLEGAKDMTIVDHAIRYSCSRVQFWNPYFDSQLIAKAHDYEIVCNVFYADTENEARRCLDMGIDAILTNVCNEILPILKEY